ncbi:MAG: PAS domain-containing protein [Azospirillum sp.]|nr:PAS domain-containing protein [Azospirillum sp.]
MQGRGESSTNRDTGEMSAARRRALWCRTLVDGRTDAIRAAFATLGVGVPDLRWTPAASDCVAEPNRFFVDHWNDLRGGRDLPLRRALDPVGLRPALGFVNLVEATDDGVDFMYRVFGSFVGAAIGRDMTGRLVSEAPVDRHLVDLSVAACLAVGLRRAPLLIRRAGAGEPGALRWERVFFPFDAGDGRVAQLAICAVPMDDTGRALRLDPFQTDR